MVDVDFLEGVLVDLELLRIDLSHKHKKNLFLELGRRCEGLKFAQDCLIVGRGKFSCEGTGIWALQPAMVQSLLARHSQVEIRFKKFVNELFGRIGDSVPEFILVLEVTSVYFIEYFGLGVAHKGGLTAQDDESDHADRPQVASLVVLAVQHFRGHIVGRA